MKKKNLKVKYVQYVREIFFGEKNGFLTGIKLNIVLKSAPLTETFNNCRNIVSEVKKTFVRIMPRKLINFSIQKFNIF